MGMPVATERYWTAEDVRQLPEDGNRYECVDGVLLVSPSPRQVHQTAVFELFYLLAEFVKRHALGNLLGSPADIGLTPDDIVQPDLFVARVRPDAPVPWNWPDITGLSLAIEVLSPSTAGHDRITKRMYYQRIGVDEYWIVDLDARLVERWRPGDERPEILTTTLVWEPRTDASLALDLAAFFKSVTGAR